MPFNNGDTHGDARTIINANESKLAGIETGATADQTGAQIKTAYEAEASAFTDAQFTKLSAIEALADVTDTANVTSAGALMDSEVDADIKTLALPANTTISAFGATIVDDANQSAAQTTLGVDPAGTDNSTAVTLAGEDFLALSGQQITANPIDLDNLSATGTPTSGNFLRGDNVWATPSGSGDVVKVGTPANNEIGVWTGDGTIEGDTALQWDGTTLSITGAVTVTGNVDGRDVSVDGSKLDAIEPLADVTDTANVTSAGALMDSEVDADIKTLSLPASTTISAFGATLVDDATQGAAQTTLDVDPSGTDNSTDVTIAGQDFLSLSVQQVTANPINLDNLSATGTPTSGNFLRGDNTWATPAGSGDVVKVGTPVNNELGVWTGDGTLEGESGLTFNAAVLALTGSFTVTGTVDGRDVATDGTKLDTLHLPVLNTQTGTTYTLALTDEGDIVEMNNASANTLTIPTNAAVAFATGTLINITQFGAGATTVTGDTGVTVNGVSAGGAAIDARYAGVALYKRGTDEWIMQGAHGAVS